jgi:hypothetical protein
VQQVKRAVRQSLNRVLPTLSTHYRAYKALIRNKQSFLHVSGWMESLKRGYPCRQDGSALPWLNYPVIAFLEERLKNGLSLFEFGSGYSTVFYARLVGAVTAVESDKGWYETVRKMMPENVNLIHRESDVDGEYCRSIHQAGIRYDVVVIDGRDRLNCVKQSIERISGRGVILFDDSHSARHSNSIGYLKGKGFSSLEFQGLKPTQNGVDRTIIFYRQDNCLDI